MKILPDDSKIKTPSNLSKILLKLLWLIQTWHQKDGFIINMIMKLELELLVKPGYDASVLRLDNGKFLAAKIDGNPKQCYLNPREGAIGCFEEACRNVVCTGAHTNRNG